MSGLQTDNLTVGYGSPLVKEISLCVRPGRVLTLIGPNGCGKSTILKSVTRQLKIMGGSIFLGGQAMETMKEAEIAKKLAMVMTEHIRPELMTCRDIVATGRYPYTGRLGILTEADWQKVEEAIAFVHAEDVAVQDFNKVSDGQRQRIMLARAICQETEILVLDEPPPIWISAISSIFCRGYGGWQGRKTWQSSCHCMSWIWHSRFRI